MLEWGKPNERYFETGLDRGVLYLPDHDPLVWNGLIGFDEGSAGNVTVYHRDGVVFYADVDPSDFSGVLTAMYYPAPLSEYIGIGEVSDGFFVDNQNTSPFGFSYRTLVGNGVKGDMFGYQIHLVYNAVASVHTRGRRTIGDGVENTEFTFDLVCTPVHLPGYRPSAHYVIDTRYLSSETVNELEELLYGTESTPGNLPTPETLADLLDFGEQVIFTVHDDGTYTVEASYKKLYAVGSSRFYVDDVNAVPGPDPGTLTISDGGNTVVNLD